MFVLKNMRLSRGKEARRMTGGMSIDRAWQFRFTNEFYENRARLFAWHINRALRDGR